MPSGIIGISCGINWYTTLCNWYTLYIVVYGMFLILYIVVRLCLAMLGIVIWYGVQIRVVRIELGVTGLRGAELIGQRSAIKRSVRDEMLWGGDELGIVLKMAYFGEFEGVGWFGVESGK